jgi:hypothetical protein
MGSMAIEKRRPWVAKIPTVPAKERLRLLFTPIEEPILSHQVVRELPSVRAGNVIGGGDWVRQQTGSRYCASH